MSESNKLRRGSIANAVFDLLQETGRPMSIESMTNRLPFTRNQVRDSASRMARDGVISTVKRGVYHYRTDVKVQVGDQLLPLQGAAEPESALPALAEVTAPQSTPAQDLTSVELDVDSIIDLVFPFKVSARDAIALMQWRHDTIELILHLRENN